MNNTKEWFNDWIEELIIQAQSNSEEEYLSWDGICEEAKPFYEEICKAYKEHIEECKWLLRKEILSNECESEWHDWIVLQMLDKKDFERNYDKAFGIN